jgi:hypothetical protein
MMTRLRAKLLPTSYYWYDRKEGPFLWLHAFVIATPCQLWEIFIGSLKIKWHMVWRLIRLYLIIIYPSFSLAYSLVYN